MTRGDHLSTVNCQLSTVNQQHPNMSGKEQEHPLYNRDRPVIDNLLTSPATDYNLVELARLRIRYQGFPGARDIQTDLDKILQQWNLTEAELFTKTRSLHDIGGIYKSRGKKEEQDWN